MSKNSKLWKTLFPALGIVFGAGAGVLVSILYSFNTAFSIIGGAIVGLLIGQIASISSGKADSEEKKDRSE